MIWTKGAMLAVTPNVRDTWPSVTETHRLALGILPLVLTQVNEIDCHWHLTPFDPAGCNGSYSPVPSSTSICLRPCMTMTPLDKIWGVLKNKNDIKINSLSIHRLHFWGAVACAGIRSDWHAAALCRTPRNVHQFNINFTFSPHKALH